MRVRRGFTLIELLVVIAIIAILAAILFPVFAKAREKARAISCLTQSKQIGLAFTQYAQDYDERFPYVAQGRSSTGGYLTWDRAIAPYVKNDQIFSCPSALRDNTRCQAINIWIAGWTDSTVVGTRSCSLSNIDKPANTVLIIEAWARGASYNLLGMWTMSNDYGGSGTGAAAPWGIATGVTRTAAGTYVYRPGVHYGTGYNDVFCDGHAKFVQDAPPAKDGSFLWYPN